MVLVRIVNVINVVVRLIKIGVNLITQSSITSLKSNEHCNKQNSNIRVEQDQERAGSGRYFSSNAMHFRI